MYKYSSKTKKQTNKVKIQRSKRASFDEVIFEYRDDELEEEALLLEDTFYSHLYLDETTGALYFNLGQTQPDLYLTAQGQQQFLYSKIAKLVNFYYYERNIFSKVFRIDALVNNITESAWINVIFKRADPIQTALKSSANSRDPLLAPIETRNKFVLNSNNLLDLFHNGDEFFVEINIDENSPTWLALDDYDLAENEGQLMNIRKYFESKIDSRKTLIQRHMLNELRYYMPANEENSYFQIDDSVNGVLLTKPAIQFDYEVARSYFTRIMIVQYLSAEKFDLNPQNSLTETNQSSQKFVYWLDVHVNVANVVDEPFVCAQPVYYISVDENEVKSKKLLTLTVLDYDKNSEAGEFVAQILTGNAQGLFDMEGLSLYTGSSSRKLDRETRAQHELDVKITHVTANATLQASRRFATCKIVVNVNDVNDNRPVLNAVELVIYNKLDTRLIVDLNVPVANAIAIDPDQISQLTYSILSVRILNAHNKQKRRQRQQRVKASRSNVDYPLEEDQETGNAK